MCFIMTLTLQAAGFSNPQDGPQARASDMASTYVPIESWVYPAFERLAAEGYLPTTFLTDGFLTPQHNAAFTLQLSDRPIGRTRQ
jgi:hypothetical protein